jgi:hypothetical protein
MRNATVEDESAEDEGNKGKPDFSHQTALRLR